MSHKIYIAGAVTNKERTQVLAKFNSMEQKLKGLGFIPINPVNIVPEVATWHDAMRTCIKALADCDGFVKLEDWEESRGAMLEVTIARNLGLLEYNIVPGIAFHKDWKKE
ncbi:MAG: DUF4406 domain-containing protein [Methylotenera sp.]|nr:DUF4406 domain-containing protein [Methylotenera sp.]